MDAFVEVVRDNLRSIDHSSLQSLPGASKLTSNLNSLEQTISNILPALPVAMRQTEGDTKAEKLMQDVTQLANQVERLINKLQSEAQHARGKFRIRSLITSVRFQTQLAELKVVSGRVAKSASSFSASDKQSDQDQADIGRESDLKDVIKRMVSEEQRIAVLRIVGPPGIGKTTLARLVYDNDEVKLTFEFRAWVSVSENFDVRRVIQDLLKSNEIENDGRDSIALYQQLQELVTNKKLLIVLDNVVEIDSTPWDEFIHSLRGAAPGSRILMTMTTHSNTTESTRSLPPYEMEKYELKGLTDDACWSLLTSVAFPDKEPEEYSQLLTVGKKMVQKCEGNPLTTKVLGRILADKMEESSWEGVLKNGPWESGDDISKWDTLFMTYDGLTARLKLCFAYCSIFPKDYKLAKEALMQLWMAEDLVQVPQEHKGTTTLETIADRYFDILKSKSFFEYSDEDEVISLHDMLSNLAHLVSAKSCYHLKSTHEDTSGQHEGENRHHSTAPHSPQTIRYMSCIYDVKMKFDVLSRYTNLRTLIFMCSPARGRVISSDEVLPHDLFKNFPELRVLSLSGLPLENLPDSIESLTNLKFLDLSHTLIEKLSITTLTNLLTLKLNNCDYLAELPNLENQTKLRHLDITGSKNIKGMPIGTGRLTDLRLLSNFIVRGLNGAPITELEDLVHLSGKLSISGLHNVVDSDDANEAGLTSKTGLRALVLEWSSKFSELRNKDVETEVLEYLKPCSNLEILSIIGYGGTRFPEWISLSQKLVRVTLSHCSNSTSLPLLGQLPDLKELRIEGLSEVVSISIEFCGSVSEKSSFPSLEILEFKGMPKWEEWSFSQLDFGGLPCLKLLKIEKCPKLKEFKVPMVALETLTINECQELRAFSLENFPKLRELDIQHCSNLKEMPQSFPSLTKLRIWGCIELTSLSKAQNDEICEEFPCLLELDIQNCKSLTELPSKFQKLEKLRVKNCKELSKLSNFPNLNDLILEECDALMLGNEVEVSSLVSMVISQLPNFKYARAQLLQCLSSLINLEISKCINLEALVENGSPALSSLKRLVVDGCPKLNQLPDILSCFSSLEELIIVGCETLEFFPEMTLPPAFKRLVIHKCKLLKSLPPKLFDSQDIGLEFLEVYGCPSLESLSKSKLPQTLKLLSLWDCSGLKSLPGGLNQENTSLASIRIWDCQSLQGFPHEGLPCNIRSLSVINCGNIKPLSQWGLENLESLRNFSFGGCPEMDNFDDVTLPDTVSFLLLKGLPKLVSLTALLNNLTSLEILTIRDCPKLETLVLADFDMEQLPESVGCLYISNCPELRKRCKPEEGEEWPKIAHIPIIEFDFLSMH